MLFRRLNWNIVGWFQIVQTISGLIIALGIGAMIYHGFAGGDGFHANRMLRLGLSFTGGTDITVKFTQPTTADKVKQALSSLGMTEESVTTAGSDGKGFIIQTQTAFANNSAPIWTALTPSHRWIALHRRLRRSVRRWDANISPKRCGRSSSRSASSSYTSRSGSDGITSSAWSPSSRWYAMRR